MLTFFLVLSFTVAAIMGLLEVWSRNTVDEWEKFVEANRDGRRR